jgi:transposase
VRQYKRVDYEAALDQTVTIREVLPPDHLARFVAQVLALLDLSAFYAHYGSVGGAAYAPEVLLGLLLYGYMTGMFSSRKIEQATRDSLPFRYLAGGMHPDHDTLANFRRTFLDEIVAVFAQVLLLAHELGALTLREISVDGSKVHADAAKSHAVSYGRLLELEQVLRAEVAELLQWGEQADQGALPPEVDLAVEIALRETRLSNLEHAQEVLEARAQERYAAELAAYEVKLREREEKAEETGRKPGGRAPQPPTDSGPRPQDQYNFTDPDSRIMKNSTDKGFDQHYNVQVAVDHASRLIVGHTLSNHPTDRGEALPTVAAVPEEVGAPQVAVFDTGYWSPDNVAELEQRGITPYIATGRDRHHQSWAARFAQAPEPPPADASALVKMAYTLKTTIGKQLYALRKSTVEPVIGIIKEVLGFRQFSLRGLTLAAGEWGLVCLAYNLKRLHRLVQL